MPATDTDTDEAAAVAGDEEELLVTVTDDGYYCIGATDDPLCLCGIRCDYPVPVRR